MINLNLDNLLGDIGSLATNIRSAITGDLSPEKKAEIEQELIKMENINISTRASIIIAEAQGKSWLQRNWRPMLMLCFIFIVANNYILFPYLHIFNDNIQILQLPDKLWLLMITGVSGYIGGRSAEKIMRGKNK